MRYSKYLMIPALAMSLTACEAEMDMQGTDPNVYYAAHPIENRVVTRNQSYQMYFTSRAANLSPQEVETLHATLHYVSPPAVESIKIHLSETDMFNARLKHSFVRELGRMGFPEQAVVFEPLPAPKRDHIGIDIRYAAVVPPDCPDWRTSPVTTYSNTWQGNFKCAQVVNIGLMVADPHDLVKGTGDVDPDAVRDVSVIKNYRDGNNVSSSRGNSNYDVNTNTSSTAQGMSSAASQLGAAP